MQHHRIHVVDQHDLPRGHEWVLAEHDGGFTLFVADDALTPKVLEEAWAGYRQLAAPGPPRPRHFSPLLYSA